MISVLSPDCLLRWIGIFVLAACSSSPSTLDPGRTVIVGEGLTSESDQSTESVSLDTAFTDDRYVKKQGGDAVDGPLAVEGSMSVNAGSLYLASTSSSQVAPELHFIGLKARWLMGIDVANNGGARDFVLAAQKVGSIVNDVLYLAARDPKGPVLGIGVTPPSGLYRVEVSAQDAEPEMGSLRIRKTPNQTGDLFAIYDSSGLKRWSLDANYTFTGQDPITGAAMSVKADPQYRRPLILSDPSGARLFGFEYGPNNDDPLFLRAYTSNTTAVELSNSGRVTLPNGAIVSSLNIRSPNVPATASSACAKGDIAYDDNYLYVCVSDDNWKRSALTTW